MRVLLPSFLPDIFIVHNFFDSRIPVELVDHYGKQEVNVVLNRHDCTFESKKEQSNFPVSSSSTSSSFAGVGRKLGDGCLTPETDSSSESSSCMFVSSFPCSERK